MSSGHRSSARIPCLLLALFLSACGKPEAPENPFRLEPVLFQATFDKPGGFEGWDQGANAVADLRVEDGCLRGTSTTKDPWFVSPPLNIEANRVSAIEIRLSVSKGNRLNLFFALDTSPRFGGERVIPVPIPGPSFCVLRIDPRRSPNFAGRMTKLRIDPTKQQGAEIAIDYVKVLGVAGQ